MYPAYIIIAKTVDILYTTIKLLYERTLIIFQSPEKSKKRKTLK